MVYAKNVTHREKIPYNILYIQKQELFQCADFLSHTQQQKIDRLRPVLHLLQKIIN